VLLNEFAAKAIFQWKFQPGGATQVQVPVEFYAPGFSRVTSIKWKRESLSDPGKKNYVEHMGAS